MIRESEMLDDVVNTFNDLSPVEFVEEYNRMFDTDYIITNVIWDGFKGEGIDNE